MDSTLIKEELNKRFHKDTAIALATLRDNLPECRFIDGYYKEGSIYVVTHQKSGKMLDIYQNNHVSIASEQWFQSHGIAIDLGHPLKEENVSLREELRTVFSSFYGEHVDERDLHTNFLQIKLTDAILYWKGQKIQIDFRKLFTSLI